MFKDPSTWVLIAFILFFILFGKKIAKLINSALDERRESIDSKIKEATLMREEAQKLLHNIKQKHLEAEALSQKIIEHARRESERMRSEAGKEVDDFLKHREKLIEERINYAESQAVQDIRNHAIQIAIDTAEKILRRKVNDKLDESLVDHALQEIDSELRS